ncbi:MAG: radical SAM protein [Gammaproteobacteria bacterium]|nr:radical SAM protein [Gammaproteobacteria bacterium]
MTKHFTVRPENFGATVYDPESLSYFFINQKQLTLLSESASGTGLPTPSPETSDPAHQDADLSGGKFTRAFTSGGKFSVRTAAGTVAPDALAAPVRVYFELTTRCNAGCKYCLNNSGSGRVGELNTDEVSQAIRNMARDGIFEIRLTGGEPTSRPDFFEAAREVQKCGTTLSVNSNLLIGKHTVERLAALRPSLLITSLDAAEQPHTRHRGPGFQRVAENVTKLRDADVPVRLNCVLSRETLPHIENFVERFARIGCGFCFILVRPAGRAGAKFSPPPLKELLAAVEKIENLRNAYPHSYFSTSFHVVMERELTVGAVNLTGCNAIQKSFNINSDGTVLPCAFLYELSAEAFTLGNIKETDYSVLPIWRHSKRLRELRGRSANCNMRCIACSHFKRDCRGTCIFMELYSERTGRPDPYCKMSINRNV